MQRKVNNALIVFANSIFWIHLLGVIYALIGVFYRFPGILWEIHFWVSVLVLVGALFDECYLTTFERWVRRKAGQKNIPNRGSRLLEELHKRTGIKLPNIVMRILGFIYSILGMGAHLFS